MTNNPWNSQIREIREIRVQKTVFKATQKITVLVSVARDT